jgi:hypothetical protein
VDHDPRHDDKENVAPGQSSDLLSDLLSVLQSQCPLLVSTAMLANGVEHIVLAKVCDDGRVFLSSGQTVSLDSAAINVDPR